MTVQFSDTLRNARLDQFETTIGASPVLEIRSGAAPANCAAGATGTLLATMTLPANFMNDASGGQKTLNGLWQTLAAVGTGIAGHFRIKQGATCHTQGSVSLTAGGGDLQLDNTNITVSQQVTITQFTLTEGNA